jgi:hypothetical protein
VYSSQIGSDVGDWDFNWIGLETAEGTLFAVSYVPLQIKRRNIPPLQIGNNLTRNFLVAFDGAQALTGISIDASTWQHDFTVRLAGIDERERLSNRDVYGQACFLGSSLQLEKVGSAYRIKPGVAYVEGIRVVRTAALPVVPPAFPCTAWIDVTLQRELSDVVASWNVMFAADRPDYTDSAGARHYCVAIADVSNANTIIDRRQVEPIDGPLVSYFAARSGDYEHLRARATTKEDVELGNLPNAKSDSLTLDSSESLATSKAVATLWKSISVQNSSFAADTVLTSAQRGLVLVDANLVNRTITLPKANAELGVVDFIIRRTDNSVNRMVVQANPDDKIKFHTHLRAEGYPFLVLMGAGDWWHLRSDGAGNWWPIGRYDNTALGRPVLDTTMTFSPGGWVALHPLTYKRTEWPWAWDHAQQSGMLTTDALRIGREGHWTTGDGVSTFRSPEARGEFFRVLDEYRGVDGSRSAGSSQGHQLESHSHLIPIVGQKSGASSPGTNTAVYGGANPTSYFGGEETRPRNIAYPGRIKLI